MEPVYIVITVIIGVILLLPIMFTIPWQCHKEMMDEFLEKDIKKYKTTFSQFKKLFERNVYYLDREYPSSLFSPISKYDLYIHGSMFVIEEKGLIFSLLDYWLVIIYLKYKIFKYKQLNSDCPKLNLK